MIIYGNAANLAEIELTFYDRQKSNNERTVFHDKTKTYIYNRFTGFSTDRQSIYVDLSRHKKVEASLTFSVATSLTF